MLRKEHLVIIFSVNLSFIKYMRCHKAKAKTQVKLKETRISVHNLKFTHVYVYVGTVGTLKVKHKKYCLNNEHPKITNLGLYAFHCMPQAFS